MTQDIENIFDANACLTRSQIHDYLAATMSTEEIEAVERHFSVCPLCREAMDGYLAHADKALETLGSLDTHFINDQIGSIQQQHPAKPVPVLTRPARKKRSLGRPPGFTSLVQVFIIGGMFILFQHELNKPVPHRAPTRTARVAAHAGTVVTKGLAEAKTDPAPPASAQRQYPEAPVGRNLKLQGTVNVAVPTNSDTGHAVVAAKLMTQPVVIQQIPTRVVAPPGSTSVTASGAASVTASSASAAKSAASRSVTPTQPEAPAPVQSLQGHETVVGANGEIEEPDISKTPPKKTSRFIGPPVDNPTSQPTTNKPATPAGPDKPKLGNDKSKADDDWLWQ